MEEKNVAKWMKKLIPKKSRDYLEKKIRRPYSIKILEDKTFTLQIFYIMDKGLYDNITRMAQKKMRKVVDFPEAWQIPKDPLMTKFIMNQTAGTLAKIYKTIDHNRKRKELTPLKIVNQGIETMIFMQKDNKVYATLVIKGVCHV